MFDGLIEWFSEFFGNITEWFVDLVKTFGQWVWQAVLDALASVIEGIPVPDFVLNAGSVFSSIPPEIAAFWGFFAISEGLAMIVSAYSLRFLIRRIPFIG